MSSGWIDCVDLFRVVVMFLGWVLVYFVAFEFAWALVGFVLLCWCYVAGDCCSCGLVVFTFVLVVGGFECAGCFICLSLLMLALGFWVLSGLGVLYSLASGGLWCWVLLMG